MPKKSKELDHELQEALKDIVKECENEDPFIRRAQIKMWKKYERILAWSSVFILE